MVFKISSAGKPCFYRNLLSLDNGDIIAQSILFVKCFFEKNEKIFFCGKIARFYGKETKNVIQYKRDEKCDTINIVKIFQTEVRHAYTDRQDRWLFAGTLLRARSAADASECTQSHRKTEPDKKETHLFPLVQIKRQAEGKILCLSLFCYNILLL